MFTISKKTKNNIEKTIQYFSRNSIIISSYDISEEGEITFKPTLSAAEFDVVARRFEQYLNKEVRRENGKLIIKNLHPVFERKLEVEVLAIESIEHRLNLWNKKNRTKIYGYGVTKDRVLYTMPLLKNNEKKMFTKLFTTKPGRLDPDFYEKNGEVMCPEKWCPIRNVSKKKWSSNGSGWYTSVSDKLNSDAYKEWAKWAESQEGC